MQSKKKNDKMHLLKTENVHSILNKKPGPVNLIEIQSFQTENVPNGVPYHDQDISVIISRRSQITLLHDFMARL